MDRVRVGVIGVGMGRNHAVHYRDAPEADLVALCDQNEGRLRQVQDETGARKAYTRVEDLLGDPEIDAVSIALPNVLHAPITIQALEAGKHVLAEKPLAMNAEEGERMVETARRTGRKLMLHFNGRFNPTSIAVKHAIEDGALGQVYFARAVWHRKRGIPQLGGWFTQKELSGGGALIDLGVHRLDLALWLMGYPKPVSVSGVAFDYLGKQLGEREGKPFDVEDFASAFIRFENGAALILETSWASNSEKREDQVTQLFGVRGGALIRNWDEGYQFEARIFRDEHGEVSTEHPDLPEWVETPQQHFCRAILSDTEPLATGEQGLVAMRIIDSIYESARTGREIRL